jgi:general stress protein YciG
LSYINCHGNTDKTRQGRLLDWPCGGQSGKLLSTQGRAGGYSSIPRVFLKETIQMASSNQGSAQTGPGAKPSNASGKPSGKSERGFAAMDPKRQREIASEGGKAAHESGHAHEFTSEEARAAGRKGGQASGGGQGAKKKAS